ncbi:TIC 62, chloroplastic (Partial), partial [Seminavis robusta]|eukprot:Sro2822_g337950.1 TIC 62, chloroplastic (327) ;mRNA; r:41-1122
MKVVSIVLTLLFAEATAFSVVGPATQATSTALKAATTDNAASEGANYLDRRSLFQAAAAATIGVSVSGFNILPANAADSSKVVVAGATGQTGRRILERLAGTSGLSVVGGVRSVDKATAALQKDSTVIRGAMVQKVASVDTSAVELKHMDVVKDSVDELASAMDGADSLVIATGFIPGNPLKMKDAAHAVDNLGTIALVDAAKKAGVKKVVMVSSILTNGRNWGQESSPGFQITNAFGGVLDEKIIAENYLRKSGLDYTIVRPGGLKAKPPSGGLIISKEDSLNSGEISRDLVADVCVAAISDPKASNKVLEIIEAEEGGPKVFNGL